MCELVFTVNRQPVSLHKPAIYLNGRYKLSFWYKQLKTSTFCLLYSLGCLCYSSVDIFLFGMVKMKKLQPKNIRRHWIDILFVPTVTGSTTPSTSKTPGAEFPAKPSGFLSPEQSCRHRVYSRRTWQARQVMGHWTWPLCQQVKEP